MTLRVHLDAAWLAPRAYSIALWWRICGKRVRARARFAPLLSASPRAYRLWLLKEPEAVVDAGRDILPIVALVDATSGRKHLDATLRSLADEGIAASVIDGVDLAPVDAAARIAWDEAPLVLAIAAGDVLAAGAGQAYRAAMSSGQEDVTLAYADDDLLDVADRRTKPHFKPDWNGELFRHFDYLTGACVMRVERRDLEGVSGPDWASRLVARAVATAQERRAVPIHVRHILHHRRRRPQPRPPAALPVDIATLPPVSVIVPTRNGLNLLRTCLEGVARTAYPVVEVIVVDNGSDDPATLAYLAGLDPARHRVLRHPGPFNFSTLNNRAARVARGSLLCLLNNDIEVLTPDWLAVMATQALRGDVGAVGARLLYPDGRIQHAGVVLGICGGAAHAHRLLKSDHQGYFRRHALPQFVSAVTAACLVVQRERFLTVGGLDERDLAVAFNDVDLCMRLNQKGWQSLYEPRATLVHHESVSRGLDRDPAGMARLAAELATMKARWNTGEGIDPFHHPQLSRFSERFAVRL